ncbi:MAG: glycosyltransferase [Caldilineaceae bacterium]
MAGGGADAYPLMSTLLDTLATVQQQQPTVYVLITGPFMPAHQRQELQQRAEGLPVHVLTRMDDTYSYLQAADLVVAMAGYNTTMEILQTGRRAILVPRRGPSAEQRTRTQLFTQLGWIDMLDPDDLSIDTLAALVKHNLQLGTTVSALTQPDLNGRQSAAQWLFALASTPIEAGHRNPSNEAYADAYFDEPETEIIFAAENHSETEERIYELA